jgi:hypothetical protein
MMPRASRWLVVLTVTAGVAFGAARGHAQDDEDSGNKGQSHGNEFNAWREFDARVLRGFRIAPVPLNLRRLNPTLVGLGSYIVNGQGACNDCHTSPPYAEGGDPFMGQPEQVNVEGYLAGGVPFGPFVSRNLTPRANGLPANLTYQQFAEVLKKGTDFKNRHTDISPLLQVMPWPVYGKMRSLDIRAIYEYLQAIPSLPTPPPPAAVN